MDAPSATLATVPSTVVVQPTSLCNIACTYCYLPHKSERRLLGDDVLAAVVDAVRRWADQGRTVGILWHSGEPLTVGPARFRELLGAPWPPGTVHRIQTNATLVDQAWCDLFEQLGPEIGVSVDGPARMNRHRVTRAGRPAHGRIEAGIGALRGRGIPFDLLSVAHDPAPQEAAELYRYARDLGARSLGVLPVETIGVFASGSTAAREQWARYFEALFLAWRADPAVDLRELNQVAGYVAQVGRGPGPAGERVRELLARPVDPFPTVQYDGEVTVISPDLSGFDHPELGPFSVGNVRRTPLDRLLARAPRVPWVRQTLEGVAACRAGCEYAAGCGGAWPSNKWFENHDLRSTTTNFCQALHQAPFEGALYASARL
ncbi:MAG TPA: radical SAM protein [Actinocrinis sp.]|nr:radical SAM protein [Actinocrinis sp.]